MFIYEKVLVMGDESIATTLYPFSALSIRPSGNVSFKSISKYNTSPPLADMAVCRYQQQTFSDFPTPALSFSALHLILFNVLPFPWVFLGPSFPPPCLQGWPRSSYRRVSLPPHLLSPKGGDISQYAVTLLCHMKQFQVIAKSLGKWLYFECLVGIQWKLLLHTKARHS